MRRDERRTSRYVSVGAALAALIVAAVTALSMLLPVAPL